jgi:hypothetical protein
MDRYDVKNKECQNGQNKQTNVNNQISYLAYILFRLHIYYIGIEDYDFRERILKRKLYIYIFKFGQFGLLKALALGFALYPCFPST